MRNEEALRLESERMQMGLDLLSAETAIGVGRRAIAELRTHDPLDQEAIDTERAQVVEARLARNALRYELDRVKGKQLAYDPRLGSRPGWYF